MLLISPIKSLLNSLATFLTQGPCRRYSVFYLCESLLNRAKAGRTSASSSWRREGVCLSFP